MGLQECNVRVGQSGQQGVHEGRLHCTRRDCLPPHPGLVRFVIHWGWIFCGPRQLLPTWIGEPCGNQILHAVVDGNDAGRLIASLNSFKDGVSHLWMAFVNYLDGVCPTGPMCDMAQPHRTPQPQTSSAASGKSLLSNWRMLPLVQLRRWCRNNAKSVQRVSARTPQSIPGAVLMWKFALAAPQNKSHNHAHWRSLTSGIFRSKLLCSATIFNNSCFTNSWCPTGLPRTMIPWDTALSSWLPSTLSLWDQQLLQLAPVRHDPATVPNACFSLAPQLFTQNVVHFHCPVWAGDDVQVVQERGQPCTISQPCRDCHQCCMLSETEQHGINSPPSP